MTSKQRAFLRKLATKIEPVVSIGKNGASPEVVESCNEALEARELIKCSVLDNCLEDVKDVAYICGERARADVVQVIGRKFVLYRANKNKPVIELPR
ncbi:MAG: ribosome assembly RNA-binding protein YhbY [Clostridia bacterium]|nr:ribosome assembly RNA-binding protein YhbY [Clostridia bacterium]